MTRITEVSSAFEEVTRRTEASSAFEEVIRTLGNIAVERPPMESMTLPLEFSL